jgi:hypothetical protein
VIAPLTIGSYPFKSKRDPLADFQKSIRRDKSHYTVLNDEGHWHEWQRTIKSTAHSHACENVFDVNYVPSTTDDSAIFREQQTFLYDVFNTILKTPMGRYYVRKYEVSRDAQSVWRDYSTHMCSSTWGEMAMETLLSELTSTKLSSNYRGTTVSFITDWMNKLKQYEDLAPTLNHFPDGMKKTLLMNALSKVPLFRNVKTSEQLEVAKGGKPLQYNNYVDLLWSVASTYDKSVMPIQASKSN